MQVDRKAKLSMTFPAIPHFKYQSVNDAMKLIKPYYFLAKVDLSNACHSVSIHPNNYKATGTKWHFAGDRHPTYLIDQRLCFGSRKAPWNINTFSRAFKSIMYSCGVSLLMDYMDDFLPISKYFEQCRMNMLDLIYVLRKLGFQINYNKVEGPTTTLKFLGIQLDTQEKTMALPDDKLLELKSELTHVYSLRKLSKKALQSGIGKFNWATQVIWTKVLFTPSYRSCGYL